MAEKAVRSKRMEAKEKAKLIKDLCFVVKWLEDEDVLYDVLAAKDVLVEGQHVHEIEVGSKGQGKYSGNFYPIEIIAKGKYSSMIKRRDELEKDAALFDESDDEFDTMKAAVPSEAVTLLDTTMEMGQTDSESKNTSPTNYKEPAVPREDGTVLNIAMEVEQNPGMKSTILIQNDNTAGGASRKEREKKRYSPAKRVTKKTKCTRDTKVANSQKKAKIESKPKRVTNRARDSDSDSDLYTASAHSDTTLELEQSSSEGRADSEVNIRSKTPATLKRTGGAPPPKTSTPKRKRHGSDDDSGCEGESLKLMKGKTPRTKGSARDSVKEAKKAAVKSPKAAAPKTAAKSKGKEMHNQERSMEIFSSLDSPSQSTLSNQWDSYNSDDYSATGWSPSLTHSASSSTTFPASSSSTSGHSSFYGPSPPWQDQGCLPFMPQTSLHGMRSYSYPSMAPPSESASMSQLTACLYELMGEVRSIKSDLKKVKRKKMQPADNFKAQDSDSSSVRLSFSPSPAPTSNCCILGDPRGDHIRIEGYMQQQVKGKEVLASDETQLALKLMDLFFTKEEMARGNCTPAEGRELLRQDVIAGIRCHINYLYPTNNMANRWKRILHDRMNGKCRNQRFQQKKKD